MMQGILRRSFRSCNVVLSLAGLLATVQIVNGQSFAAHPESAKVLQGSSVILKCEVEDIQGATIQWTRNNFGLGTDRALPNFPRYRIIGAEDRGEFNLLISNAQLEDDKVFQCQIGATATRPGVMSEKATVSILATAELEITTKGYEFTQIVHEAELVLPCVVEGEGFDSFIHQLSWYKTDREGNDVLMNSRFTILEPFDETNRHQLDLERKQMGEKPSVAATLTILDVQLEDNGTYTCKLTHKDSGLLSSVEHSITVQGPIESLTLSLFANATRTDPSTNKTVFDFVALRPSYVSCKSVGGQPQPTVTLLRGDFDITNEFEKKEKVDVTGARGLERAIYETELVSDVFRAEIDDQGDKLTCIARIHHTPKFKQIRSGIMEVTYPPSFDCESYAYAEPGTENFTINCQVKGNPEVHVDSIFWIVGESNGTNITVNDTHKGLTIDITEDEEDKHAVHASLTISLVNETSYQGYILRAKNTVGEGHYEILLNQPTTTQSTTTTKKPKTKAVGSEDDDNGVGLVHCSASILLMILLTGAHSW